MNSEKVIVVFEDKSREKVPLAFEVLAFEELMKPAWQLRLRGFRFGVFSVRDLPSVRQYLRQLSLEVVPEGDRDNVFRDLWGQLTSHFEVPQWDKLAFCHTCGRLLDW